MNAAAVHLALNNFPPIINFAAVLVLGIGLGARSAAVVRTALVLMVVAAIFAVPTFLSGEPTEELVERLDGVNSIAIHPHEEAGEWAIWVLSIEGLAALAALIAFRSREMPRWVPVAMLIVSLIGTATVFRTAYLGGKIHHPEREMTR
jgi:uncharacterized membrane protein